MTTTNEDDRAARLRDAIRLKKATGPKKAKLPSRPAGHPAQLSDMQHSLWLLHRMAPESSAYNLVSAARLSATLDETALQRAFNEVVSQHRLLRSSFYEQEASVFQRIHPHSDREIEVLEVETEALRTTAAQIARRPFDLTQAPLIRLVLLRASDTAQGLLMLVLHHIIADEDSLVLIWRLLAQAYHGRQEQDATPAVQYDDYEHWRVGRNTAEKAQQFDYWRDRLYPLPDDLALPFARTHAVENSAAQTRGRLLRQSLSPGTRQEVASLATATGSTPFVVYAFAFRLLLQRYTEGRRVAFGTPVSTRAHPATHEMLGYFLNPVVVCSAIDESHVLERALRDFGTELRDDLARTAIPFDQLVERLAVPRQVDQHPLFQSMFVYQREAGLPDLGNVQLEPVTLDLGESKFDLTLFVSESEHGLEVGIEYRCDRFDEVWMRQMAGHYQTLLENLMRHSDDPVAEVPLLSTQAQVRLTEQASGVPLELAESASFLLPYQIWLQAESAPEAIALRCGDASWNYAELAAEGRRLAAVLVSAGVRPGDRVALFVERSPWLIAGVLGCHWAAAAYVPLDPDYPSQRNSDLLEDAQVSVVLSSVATVADLPRGPWVAIEVDRVDIGTSEKTQQGPLAALPAVSAEATAYVLYTSGSSGRPKGVVVTQGNLHASTAARLQFYPAPPGCFLLLSSVAFDSSVAGIFWTLATAGSLVIPTEDEARDPQRLLRLIVEQEVTHLLCVPSLYAQLLEEGGDHLHGLQVVIVAGESCPRGLVESHYRILPQVALYNEYGPTEACVWSSVQALTPGDGARPVAIGRPIPGVRIELLDDRGRRVPPGVPGQAWICGPNVAAGYWRREDLSAECFTDSEDRYGVFSSGQRRYRSGDRMVRGEDGRLLFLGRVDDQIKLRGFRFEPGEIEAALLALPGIAQAVVLARSIGATAGEGGTEDLQLVAFIETSQQSLSEAQRAALAQRLPAFMMPARVVACTELPCLPNGKIDRQQLMQRALDTEVTPVATPQVADIRAQGLIALWQGLLGQTGVGVDDNFFRLGGHSLLVMQMLSVVERDFGVRLQASDVFQNPTVAGLAQRIAEHRDRSGPVYHHLFPIQPGGQGSPFVFCVPHFFSDTLARHFRGERPFYGLRGVGLRAEGNRGRWPTMRDLAETLVDEVQRRFPGQACFLAGYSFGASMAVEAARVMEERGLPARRLYLIAPMPIEDYRLGPLRVRLDALRKPVDELGFAEALTLFMRANPPFRRRTYRHFLHVVGTWVERRLLCGLGSVRRAIGLPLTPRILHADVRLERFRLHQGYRPGSVHTATVFFNAREPKTDAAATWRPFFKGGFSVHEIPDPHLDEVEIETAKQLILEQLNELKDDIQGPPGSEAEVRRGA